ncbi:VRR-NUC domain-containing protein [Paraburkholderia aspalathi]|nr:VRR-NUC domain-containing protein [Paraburkholderia aspalathi]
MRPKFVTIGESGVVRASNNAAKKAGFLHRKVVYQGRRGAPDDWYFGFNGRLIIVEHKRPGKKPDPHQEREISRLRERGFDVRVVSTIEGAERLFRGEELI